MRFKSTMLSSDNWDDTSCTCIL